MKYVGATDFFVKSPFVFEGIIIGLITGFANLHPAAGKVTVNAATYVAQENRNLRIATDGYMGRETKTRQLNNNNVNKK